MACDSGDADGCVELGAAYYKGEGVNKDPTKAADLYRKACDGGVAKACYYLGNLHFSGDGVERDLTKVAALLKNACDGSVGIRAYSPGRARSCLHSVCLSARGLFVDGPQAVSARP